MLTLKYMNCCTYKKGGKEGVCNRECAGQLQHLWYAIAFDHKHD